jgi:cytosine/adenosine deaminase-related metal-dependent hydrolase
LIFGGDLNRVGTRYAFTGTGYDLPLLEWLNKYTFPVEAKFKEAAFAQDVYTKAVRRLLINGTTTACYFGLSNDIFGAAFTTTKNPIFVVK